MEKYRKFADTKTGVNPFLPLNKVRKNFTEKFGLIVKFNDIR